MKNRFNIKHTIAFIVSIMVLIAAVNLEVKGSGITQAAYYIIKNAGSMLTPRPVLNCSTGTTCTDDSVNNQTIITATPPGSLPIQSNGSAVGTATTFNLVPGSGISLTPSFSGGLASITINASGGGGGGSSATRGTFSARPTCASAGALYYSTDIPDVSECDGFTWADWVLGFPVTLPSNLSWTPLNLAGNCGGAGTLVTNGVMTLTGTASSCNMIVGATIPLPSTPYTRTAGFMLAQSNGAWSNLGIMVSDSTGAFFSMGLVNQGTTNYMLATEHWSGPNSWGGLDATAPNGNYVGPIMWFRVSDDGVNITYTYSMDGLVFLPFRTLARTTYTGMPATLGFFVGPDTGTGLSTSVTLVSWQ
jgi:hypothetical protein